jgi:hypothetical protein
MTAGQVFVIAMRLVIPLLILKRPLVGGVAAMLLDALDVVIVEFFGEGGMGPHYHNIDKVLDLYYLALELWVALSWVERIPRLTAIGLFVYRVIGVVIFEPLRLSQSLRALVSLLPDPEPLLPTPGAQYMEADDHLADRPLHSETRPGIYAAYRRSRAMGQD